jgi:hypothetical protein
MEAKNSTIKINLNKYFIMRDLHEYKNFLSFFLKAFNIRKNTHNLTLFGDVPDKQ